MHVVIADSIARQQERDVMTRFTRSERRERHRIASAGAYPAQAAARSGREDDLTIRCPGAAATSGRIGDRDGRSANDVDPFELALSEERNGSTVGRPERKRRAFRAG